ncbi:MAG: pyridoxal-phosphate dependent enzyme [Candidatus Brocadiae bacterium]|nr:pyridoxal-phosphate dependent enzyme [Candidatus Brocadiia bacterium]
MLREEILENTVKRCREKHIIIPTYKQMRNPELIPQKIREKLRQIGLWDLNSLNLFRITWKNEPVKFGGSFSQVNFIEFPPEITGVQARIMMLVGKFFPTGAHKVGASFGPLVEKLVTGRFDPTSQKALWPSTGNYCRGGAYVSYLLGCDSVAILPEEMSKERFEWLHKVGAEVFATHGCESNVKEIYDKVKELEAERGDSVVALNQFSEIGNPLWHYAVTGPAIEEVFKLNKKKNDRLSAIFLTQGSTGTLGATDYLRERFPLVKVCAGEALQCPTLLYNGYGGHRIEGIGDKHVPWVHNIRNMDMVAGIDDEVTMGIMRLFNEPEGKKHLLSKGVSPQLIEKLELLGISGIANLAGAIKMAKYYEMTKQDIVFTIATDSMEMYQSRLREQTQQHGEYTEKSALIDYAAKLMKIGTDHIMELSYYDKKRIHNLKYFTWVEQQGKTVEELNAQWYDENYWKSQFSKVDEWDEKIMEFNERTGLLAEYK